MDWPGYWNSEISTKFSSFFSTWNRSFPLVDYFFRNIFSLIFRAIVYRLGSKADSFRIQCRVSGRKEKKRGMSIIDVIGVFLDISNNIRPRAQTKWKVLKWYRDGRGCNILRILKSFDEKHHSIFNVSRIHRKLDNVLRNLFVRWAHRSHAPNSRHFYRLQ